MLSRLHPLLLAALMGKAGKDGQLGVHPVVLQVLLQALHAGHAVVAVRRIADELGVVFADDDQNGDFLDRCKVNVMPEVVLEIPGARNNPRPGSGRWDGPVHRWRRHAVFRDVRRESG